MTRLGLVVPWGLLALLLAVVVSACSGNRDERLPSSCVTDTQCGSEALCLAGRCVTSSELTSITGKVAGAPEGVVIASQEVEDVVCELKQVQGLVCTLEPGGRVVLMAPEVEGHRFIGWSGKGCESEEHTLEVAVERSTICIANYARRLRVSGRVADNAALPVLARSQSPTARCDAQGCEVDASTPVVLQAPERDGFRITGFEGKGCERREGYRVTVTPSTADVLCIATYVESLTVRGQTQGLREGVEATIVATSPSPGSLCEGQLCAVSEGARVSLRAPEVAGHRFRGWMGDPRCTGSEPELVLDNVVSNALCTADYVPRFSVQAVSEGVPAPLSVSFVASSENMFSSCEGPRCLVDRGESVTLIASAVEGYRLVSWSGAGCAGLSGASASAREVLADVTCTAHFVAGVSVTGTLVNVDGEVEASSGAPGAVCARGSCAIEPGGSVTLRAPAIMGRTFLGWSGDEGCSGSELTITLDRVTRSKSCRATYAARFVALGRPVPAPGGSVAASSGAANAVCLGARCDVDEGSAVTLSASAAAGYRFTGWTGGGPCVGAQPALALTDLRSSITCDASFVARITIAGAVNPANAGSVLATQASASAECAAASCIVDAGSSVTLTATPSAGFTFSSWTGCGSPLDPLLGSASLPVIAPLQSELCTANFERLRFPVSAVAAPGGSVTASTAGVPCVGAMCVVGFGDSATLQATPALGYSFAGWTGDCASTAAVYELTSVQQATSCTATFARVRVSLTGITAPTTVGGVVASSSSPGASCVGASCSVEYGGSVRLEAQRAVAGFQFSGWRGCEGAVLEGTSATLTNLTVSRTCSAAYTPLYTVTSRSEAPTMGSTSCANGCVVPQGGQVVITAVPSSTGYYLESWLGCAGVSDVANRRITVSNVGGNVTCVAKFNTIPQ